MWILLCNEYGKLHYGIQFCDGINTAFRIVIEVPIWWTQNMKTLESSSMKAGSNVLFVYTVHGCCAMRPDPAKYCPPAQYLALTRRNISFGYGVVSNSQYLSVSVVGWLVTSQLEGSWKEAVMAEFEATSPHFLWRGEGGNENHSTSH
jgi:hypothetical protein